jgi:hypothetical protein
MSGSNLNEPYLFLNQSSIQDDNFNSKIMIVQMDSTIEDDEVLTDCKYLIVFFYLIINFMILF